MQDIIPTESQKDAIKQACHWYHHRTHEQQVFRIYGYAGVGKTTIVRSVIDELGLSQNKVRFATLTGKAALVMQRHGLPASTIHQLIYGYSPATGKQINAASEQVEELRVAFENAAWFAKARSKTEYNEAKHRLAELQKPRFKLKEESALNDAKLLVLDECSMIDVKTANDLLSFGKPIILLGDPGQLPPIQGDPMGGFGNVKPDVFLEEIHRQALDSAIIRMATNARLNQPIDYGAHSDVVFKINKKRLGPADLLRFDQVICGYNKTRLRLNNAMRQSLGFTDRLPVGKQEKVIVLRNDHTIGLLNGQFITLDQILAEVDTSFLAEVETDASNLGIKSCYSGYFLDHVKVDPDRNMRDWKMKRSLIEPDFGYAITCHKAQGSGWKNVVVYDDGWNMQNQRHRWLYTAITRSEYGLFLLA
jgi:exodeoxyribonuclease-5